MPITVKDTTIKPNEKQLECIKTLEGPVMVLAGPGTGKTFTVIERIKYMLETNIKPEHILCLTFSESAASEMKNRLIKELGTKASGVVIHTYHAFCHEIIKQYPLKFELLDNVNIVDNLTQRSIMKECIDEIKPEFLKTQYGDSYFYIDQILSSISDIKKNRITKDLYNCVMEFNNNWEPKLQQLLQEKKEREASGKALKTFLKNLETHEKKLGKAEEIWKLYELYSKKLKSKNYIDFNDMINFVIEAFESDEEFLKEIASSYKYILVDEYQDTNYSQNQIIFYLSKESGNNNIFVVGDDDQIIYGFQGAQTDNLAKFLKLFPDTKVICLQENNRSTQPILDLSAEIIGQDNLKIQDDPSFKKFKISKTLTAKNLSVIEKTKKVTLSAFKQIEQENTFIIERIKELINSNTLIQNKDDEPILSEIAILTRYNKEIQEFATLLRGQGIPYQMKTAKSIFEVRSSILFYFYLQTIENAEFHADKLFGLLLSEPFNFNKTDYQFLVEQNQLNHKDFINNIYQNKDHKWLNPEAIETFIRNYETLTELKSHETLKDLIIEIVNQSGILEYYTSSSINKFENLSAIKRIIDEADLLQRIKPTASLKDFLDHLSIAKEENIPLELEQQEEILNAVQLLTLHGAKGREFEYVFIPHLTASNWEKKKDPNSLELPIEKVYFSTDPKESRKAEQLRLLFVAITRAKHSLSLSFSNMIGEKVQELTEYLSQIDNNEIMEKAIYTDTPETCVESFIKSVTVISKNYDEDFKKLLKDKLKRFNMSASALNSYLNCPRSFLYSWILNIPIKDKDSAMANYGSAVHQTLEWAIVHSKKHLEYPEKQMFLEVFLKKLSTQRFCTLLERQKFEERGKKKLDAYYKTFTATSFDQVVATEFLFTDIRVENCLIKGFIDRIEQTDNNTYALYDYKTGSAKTKAQIADGQDYESYLNQLRFYQLAFQVINPGAEISQVGLIFVENPEKSYYTKLLTEDMDNIKQKIVYAHERINKLEFDAVDTESRTSKNCTYCDYKLLCRLDVI